MAQQAEQERAPAAAARQAGRDRPRTRMVCGSGSTGGGCPAQEPPRTLAGGPQVQAMIQLKHRLASAPRPLADPALGAALQRRAYARVQPPRGAVPSVAAEPGTVAQRAPCGDDRQEWYAGNRSAVARALAGDTGMDIAPDLAHVICCAFCEAMSRTWAEGGGTGGGAGFVRYTALFERLAHEYHAQTGLYGGGARNVYTEEAYWLPTNPAAFAAATGLALVNAHRIDQAFWNAVQGVMNAPFNTAGAGVYPAGLPAGDQGDFDRSRGTPQPMGAAPANPWRRSYSSRTILRSGFYKTLRWMNGVPGPGTGTAWDVLHDALAGHMRILDFAGDRTPGAGGAPRHTVVDAKFSYPGGGHDDWGPGQAADQQTIYQAISGGGPAAEVPRVTWDACGCSQETARQLSFEKETADISASLGKRREADRIDRARKRHDHTEESLKFIDSATLAWDR
jgi:hypothetical protein